MVECVEEYLGPVLLPRRLPLLLWLPPHFLQSPALLLLSLLLLLLLHLVLSLAPIPLLLLLLLLLVPLSYLQGQHRLPRLPRLPIKFRMRSTKALIMSLVEVEEAARVLVALRLRLRFYIVRKRRVCFIMGCDTTMIFAGVWS